MQKLQNIDNKKASSYNLHNAFGEYIMCNKGGLVMANKYQKLFEPMQIGKLQIKNRISMAPMGPVGFTDDNGGFNERGQEYYVERAKGGTGLIITGICNADSEVEKLIRPSIPCPTMNPPAFIMAAYPMVERIHAYDAKVFLQLTAGLGRAGIPSFIKNSVAPSEQENRWDPAIMHRELTIEEIQTMIANFAMSAAIAQKAGFDGVEIHAVHEGYLLDQFAIAFYNKRNDAFGGSLEGRLKFATEIVKAVKSVCGKDFPVSLRYSLKSFIKGLRQGAVPGEEFVEQGRDIQEGIEAAKILVEAGYDALNVDAGTYDSWYWNHPPMYFEHGMYREFGKIVKQNVNVPVILAGRMDDPDIACSALGDSCDMVSYGRPLLADPYLPEKIRTGKIDDIRPCISCHEGCMGRLSNGAPISCAVNPACGREAIYGINPAAVKKKVLVVGGGLAGLEAARVCTLRGHNVTVVEKSGQLGGNIIPGSVPDFKKDDRRLIKWYEKQMKDLKVEVKMNTTVDKKFIEEFDADVVIIATGSNPIMLDFGDKNHVCTASDVLNGVCDTGENIVVVGGGLVGCETALWLRQQNKNVTVVEMAADILGGEHALPFMNYDMLKDLLAFNSIKVYKNSKVAVVNDESVIIETTDDSREMPADTVVIAAGYKSERSLIDSLNDTDATIYNIGDSRRVKNIMYAIWDAYELARNI